ncbi:MAG: hypothetical protein LUH07_10995 [Lachnospiraceae bacterium]|nr:hypothetical protein [Lachnospiraceae bacterium]
MQADNAGIFPGPGGQERRGNHGGPGGHGGPSGAADDSRRKKYDKPFSRLYYALSRGIVVVTPGARGRDNVNEDGTFFGKAPAAIVDLKAAVRYIRHNRDTFPGNVDKIFSNGNSAGGAMSALLGASGDYPGYESYLSEIGAAQESDYIMGTICHCPIMDLDHSDAAYEWMFGKYPRRDGTLEDQTKSEELADIYADYLRELNLQGRNGYGTLTADNLGEYIVKEFMLSSADRYLNEDLGPEERDDYLRKNPWIQWDGRHADFHFDALTAHIGRMKTLGSFDGSRTGEMTVFGNRFVDGRHYTEFGARQEDPKGKVEPEVQDLVKLMNPMFFVRTDNPGCCKHWYLCVGSKDPHTSHSVSAVFQTLLENKGMDSSLVYLWDYGHVCDDDPVEMIDWIWKVAQNG